MRNLSSRILVLFGVFLFLVPCGVFAQEPIQVAVDIKPGGCENPLNVKSQGVLPVAILGTEVFDVTTIDPASIRMFRVEGDGVAPIRSSVEDVASPPSVVPTCPNPCTDTETSPDGYMDLTLKFKTQEVVSVLGDVSDGECVILFLTGNLEDDTPIAGQEVVRILKKGKPKQ